MNNGIVTTVIASNNVIDSIGSSCHKVESLELSDFLFPSILALIFAFSIWYIERMKVKKLISIAEKLESEIEERKDCKTDFIKDADLWLWHQRFIERYTSKGEDNNA